MDLFEHASKVEHRKQAPLAVRMRPRTLDEFEGQEKIMGEGSMLRRAILRDRLQSLILYGPPGTGKTALAVIANMTESYFVRLNVSHGNGKGYSNGGGRGPRKAPPL